MKVNFKVKRYNSEKGSYFQTYPMDVSETETILSVLLEIRGEKDQTLGMRCSCRSAICGSCTMKINGKSRLACNTQIKSVISNGEIILEPAGNQNVIRDLIVDLTMFWDKIKSATPYLKNTGPSPEREYLCEDESMLHLSEVTECIMCGACVSDCTVLEVDKTFMGPAALAKVYRFISDPRDTIDKERLKNASESGGIWDCTHCFMCVEACPKNVLPMNRILDLRRIAMENGFTNNTGARHSKAITESVEHSGSLNEMVVLPKSHGYTNIKELIALIPGGIRMLKRGKMPSPFHKSIQSVGKVKEIFKKFAKKEEE